MTEGDIVNYVCDENLSQPEPYIFIQWKNTDVCLDFHCECGEHLHFDGFFLYAIGCGVCGRSYSMPSTIRLKPLPSDSRHEAKIVIPDDR